MRRSLPSAKIVLTFHEYLAICHRYGQMVTTDGNYLCYQSSAMRCNSCFPEYSQADFFLRQVYIQKFLAAVDQFIAPSHFLAQRMIEWGIPGDKLRVIENLTSQPSILEKPAMSDRAAALRIGFFGQLSPLKGINVLFDAARILEREHVGNVVFDVHGDYRNQPPEFQEKVVEWLEGAGSNVRYHGSYDRERVDGLMKRVDLIVVPSVWWENSPVVIQEAFRNRRPIICSDIGGMAEKVRDGEDGWHFPVGSPIGLAALLRRLAEDPNLICHVSNHMRRPPEPNAVVDAHLDAYTAAVLSGRGNDGGKHHRRRDIHI